MNKSNVFLTSSILLGTLGVLSSFSVGATTETSSGTYQIENRSNSIGSGLNGDVSWTLDSDGVLSMSGGTFETCIKQNLENVKEDYPSQVKKIILKEGVNPGNASWLFDGLPELEYIDGLENLDTSHQGSMNFMFANTPKLKSLDLKSFITINTYSMEYMFAGSGVEQLDLSNFNTLTKVNTSKMFLNAHHLKVLKLGENFAFNGHNSVSEGCCLPDIIQNSEYTGNWQDLGDGGTPEHPKGEHLFTSAELVKKYDGETMAGTFVWQPNTLYGGKDLTAQTRAIGQANATANLETQLEDPFGKKVNVIATITDGAGAEVQNGQLEKGKYTVTYTGTTTNGQTATVTNVLIVTDPGEPVIQGGHITVQHVDTAGKSISSDALLKGNVGDTIKPSQKSISGYTYKSTTWPDTTHKFTAKTQTVKLVYSKNAPPTPTPQTPISVYRLYNKKSMEHLYTKDAHEYNNLPKKSSDWVREGANFKAYAKADVTTQAVYRVYNPKSGEHLFTTDSNEVKVLTTQCGWKNEGVAWHSPKAGKEVYRLFNPKAGLGGHFVTADANERKVLTTKPNEWKYEGIAWLSVK
ncbi:MucBP domain-containing protein [Lactococcus garvieae]|uniref:MucBP domain-containing protein n=1 Tax=Lactococcus garvieae TaxID=1363 RepID=UPI00385251AF